MSKLFFLVCLLVTNSLLSQEAKLYNEKTATGYIIFADNYEYCPVTIEINFTLNNLKSDVPNGTQIVLPPNAKRQQVNVLTVEEPKKKYRYKVGYGIHFGNHTTDVEKSHDFVYQLPFGKGKSFFLGQGYNGVFSHRGINAIDFDMSVGTKIYAARGGVVVAAESSNSQVCARIDCMKYNNYILIYHEDGTFSEYSHIKQGGVVVKRGEKIKGSQHIGYSGNVGFSSGPHLHFVVFRQKMTKRETLKTKFYVDNQPVFLEEKQYYKR